jgi:arylsulfatase B
MAAGKLDPMRARAGVCPMELIRIFLLVWTATWAGATGAAAVPAPAKPNVIVVMTDDQGYGDLACHGNPVLLTPNLDRLYEESFRFTDFHVNPFCSPTRAALMTGRMSDRTHVRSTIRTRNHLNRDETTMAEFFKASGYRTGHFGKWHLGHNYPYRPIDRGFDQWVGHGDGGIGTSSDYWGNDKMNDTYLRNGRWEKFSGFCTDIFFDEAMKFISAEADEPFFIYLATNVPHIPWNVLRDWRTPYEGKVPDDTADFFATIARFDRNLGRLRSLLDERGIADNTILVYLTDNGTSGGDNIFNAGMRGKKGSVYEGGHRVPCFIHWPNGHWGPPGDIDRLTAHVDLLPTLIDLCGLTTPKRGHLPFDGRSLAPLLKDPSASWEDRTLFMHMQNTREKPVKGMNALVATATWRLINGRELYDIKADPGQQQDVAGAHPDTVAELRKRYDAYWDEVGLERQPYPRPIVGSDFEEETWLTCDAWIPDRKRPYTWNQPHVLNAAQNGGFWPVEIARAARYRFEVRRWPKEVHAPITAALPASGTGDITSQGKPVRLGTGKAIPAVRVILEAGGREVTGDIGPADPAAVFELDLPAGPLNVRAWLVDEAGKRRSAYYIYVRPA